MEQMSLFDYIRAPDAFCWDDDINYLHGRLTEISKKHGFTTDPAKWEIWDHCPQDGYRMTFYINVTRGEHKEFIRDIENLVKEAKKRGIYLSPMYDGVYFFWDDETAQLLCFTEFLDERKKCK